MLLLCGFFGDHRNGKGTHCLNFSSWKISNLLLVNLVIRNGSDMAQGVIWHIRMLLLYFKTSLSRFSVLRILLTRLPEVHKFWAIGGRWPCPQALIDESDLCVHLELIALNYFWTGCFFYCAALRYTRQKSSICAVYRKIVWLWSSGWLLRRKKYYLDDLGQFQKRMVFYLSVGGCLESKF